MKKKKVISILMVVGILISMSNVNVKGSEENYSSANLETKEYSKDILNNSEVEKMRETINSLLELKFKVMKSGVFESCSNIVSNQNLKSVIDKTSGLYNKWCKKNNLKCESYESNTNIDSIDKVSNNKYIVDVTHSIMFKMEGSDVESKSSGEKYKFEVNFENGKFTISKMQDVIQAIENNSVVSDDILLNQSKSSMRSIEPRITDKTYNNIDEDTDFINYESEVDSKLSTLSEMEDNFEELSDKYNDMLTGARGRKDITARAYSYNGYNHQAGVDYAHKWATQYNPFYKSYPDNDCTNFVSQCAYAGGIPTRGSWLFYSRSWLVVQDFYNYMIGQGYASDDGLGCKNARLGDVIQLFNKNKQQYSHSVILTKEDDTGVYYSAHSKFRYDYPMWQPIMDGDYSNLRVINFW